MSENKGLLGSAWSMVANNKRYILWFYLLNLSLAWLGSVAFSNSAHEFLDRSLYSDGILHGFHVAVFGEMLSRPEFGSTASPAMSASHFALVFFLLTALFLPGVFQGYASNYRLPREDFFRACGRNLWRFIRLLFMAAIIMGIAAAALFGLQAFIATKAAESTNELLAPELQFAGLAVIFLIMTVFRIAFDLAETDIVLSNQNKVRKSVAAGLRHAFGSLFRLLTSYVVITIVALVILAAGLFVWEKHVPSPSVVGAFVVSQITLFLLLIPRFWQRAVAVAYYKQNMVQPVVAFQPFIPVPVTAPVATPVTPEPPPAPEVT
jgi:hypothetical protein